MKMLMSQYYDVNDDIYGQMKMLMSQAWLSGKTLLKLAIVRSANKVCQYHYYYYQHFCRINYYYHHHAHQYDQFSALIIQCSWSSALRTTSSRIFEQEKWWVLGKSVYGQKGNWKFEWSSNAFRPSDAPYEGWTSFCILRWRYCSWKYVQSVSSWA